MSEPSKVYAGDLLEWTKTLSDYPAPTWTLNYYLLNASARIAITAAASGTDHQVSVAIATTADYVAGDYRMTGVVDNGVERHTILDRVPVTVLADPATATSGVDQRDHIDRTIEAIEATIEGKATHDHLSHSVEGTSISRMSPVELLGFLDRYKTKRAARDRRARALAGKTGHSGRILARFL